MSGRSHHRKRNAGPGHLLRLVHFTQGKAGRQKALDCYIHCFFINLSLLHRFYQGLVTRTAFQVSPTQHRSRRSGLCIRMRLMTIISVKIGNSSTVRKDNTVKSPLIAQNLHQQAVATATRIALKTVVGTHHLLHFSFFHQSFERRKISFIQITGLDIFRIKLMAVPFRT